MANLSNINNKFIVTDGGNVGINSTGPGEKLEVNGNIQSLDTIYLKNASSGVKWQFYRDGSDTLNFRYNNGTAWNSNAISIKNDNNVGIGTTSPNALLSLGNAINARKLLLYDDNNNFKYGFGIQSNELRQFFPNSATSRMVIGTISDSDGTTFSEKIRISSSGNVGIGTTDLTGQSDRRLVLDGTFGTASIEIKKEGDRIIYFGTGSGSSGQDVPLLLFYDGGVIKSQIDSAGNSFFNGGNVGIGTTGPSTKLDVRGTGNFLGTAASGAPLVTIENNSGSTATSYGLLVKGGGNSASGKTFEVRDSSSNTDLIVKGNGNIAIGGLAATAKLQVNATPNAGAGSIAAFLVNSSITVGTEVRLAFAANTNDDIASNRYSYISTMNTSGSNGQDMLFATNSSGNPAAETMRITSDGTVIIGAPSSAYNTTQGYSFHAVADYTAQSYISIARKGQTSGSQGVVIGLDTSNAYIQVRDNINLILGTNNQGQQWIQPNGNVGIGISGPNSRLSVLGVIQNQDAYADPSFTVTSVGMSVVGSGSIQFTQGWAGTSAAGDTVVFRYNAASWKSWNLDYTFSSTSGMVKGTIGGYNNNSGGGSNAFLKNDFSITCVGTNVGQSVVVTFTGNFGIHMNCNMRYSQGGGDGAPQSTRAFLTYNS